jgi:hypothetical protein
MKMVRGETRAGSRAFVLGCAGLAALFVASVPKVASADDKMVCMTALDKAQQLRDEGQLRRAREEMVTCARDACPLAIRKDCSSWLSAIDATLPSIVVTVRDPGGKDLVKVRVSVDGQPLASSLDGKAVNVDPGLRHFRFEADGNKPLEREVLIREGEQRRSISVQLSAPEHDKSLPPPAAPRKTPTAAFVVGGLGIVALGSFAAFGILGKKEAANLRDTCGVTHSCSESDVNATRAKLIIADVSLGTSVLALGIATYLFLSNSSTKSTSALQVGATPIARGGAGAVGFAF